MGSSRRLAGATAATHAIRCGYCEHALGIGGSVLATYGGQALGLYQAGQGAGFIGSVVGAIILLVIVGALRKR